MIARKCRPQTFTDAVSQEHVKTTLENAITQQRIAHGYIFAGQRGTGKTTVARGLNCIQGRPSRPAVKGAVYVAGRGGVSCRDEDFTRLMLSVAPKPFPYHVLAAETGRWSPIHDLIVNYVGFRNIYL